MRRLSAFVTLSLMLILLLNACKEKPPVEQNPVQTRAPMLDHADWFIFNTAEDLFNWVDVAFTGKVIGITSKNMNFMIDPPVRPDGSVMGEEPYTIYEVEIDSVYQGDYAESRIQIASRGGIENGVEYVWDGAVPVEYEREYLFLIHTTPAHEEVLLINPFQSVYDLDAEVREQNASTYNPIAYEDIIRQLETGESDVP